MILLSYLIPHRNKRTSIARDDANLVALQQQTTTCFRHILPVSLMFILIRVCQRFQSFRLSWGSLDSLQFLAHCWGDHTGSRYKIAVTKRVDVGG